MNFTGFLKLKIIKIITLIASTIACLTLAGAIFSLEGDVRKISDFVFNFFTKNMPFGTMTAAIFILNVLLFGIIIYAFADFKEKIIVIEEARGE